MNTNDGCQWCGIDFNYDTGDEHPAIKLNGKRLLVIGWNANADLYLLGLNIYSPKVIIDGAVFHELQTMKPKLNR